MSFCKNIPFFWGGFGLCVRLRDPVILRTLLGECKKTMDNILISCFIDESIKFLFEVKIIDEVQQKLEHLAVDITTTGIDWVGQWRTFQLYLASFEESYLN